MILKIKKNDLLKRQSRFFTCITMLIGLPITVSAIGGPGYISTSGDKGLFTLSASGASTTLCIDSKDFPGVIRALKDLKSDIGKVMNYQPTISFDKLPHQKEVVIVGTLGKSQVIDQ